MVAKNLKWWRPYLNEPLCGCPVCRGFISPTPPPRLILWMAQFSISQQAISFLPSISLGAFRYYQKKKLKYHRRVFTLNRGRKVVILVINQIWQCETETGIVNKWWQTWSMWLNIPWRDKGIEDQNITSNRRPTFFQYPENKEGGHISLFFTRFEFT